MLRAIMGIGAGIAKGIMGNQAKKDQFEENKQLMEYQAELNKQQAFYSTGLARDLWNYTNYENTMRHIKGIIPYIVILRSLGLFLFLVRI